MPTNMQSSLIFHYNLKFYDSDGDTYDAVSLKRFVMQVGVYYFSQSNILWLQSFLTVKSYSHNLFYRQFENYEVINLLKLLYNYAGLVLCFLEVFWCYIWWCYCYHSVHYVFEPSYRKLNFAKLSKISKINPLHYMIGYQHS